MTSAAPAMINRDGSLADQFLKADTRSSYWRNGAFTEGYGRVARILRIPRSGVTDAPGRKPARSWSAMVCS